MGDLGTNQMVIAEYDGGGIQILNPTANDIPAYTKGFGTITSATIDGTNHTVTTDCFIVGTINNPGATSASATIANSSITLTCQGYNVGSPVWNIPFCLPTKSGDHYNITLAGSATGSAYIVPIS